MNIRLILFIFLVGELMVNVLPTPIPAPIPLQARQDNAKLGSFKIVGKSGVSAMHAVLIAPRKVVFIDKLEQNYLKRSDGIAAVSSEYNLDTNEVRPLGIYTNTFCSAGSFLGNGTLVESGGDKGDTNYRSGIQTLRLFDESIGDWIELEGIMPSNRWYPAMVSLPSGSVMILGGSTASTGIDRGDINNPTYAIYPPPSGTMQDVPFPFLTDSLPYNLYPMVHVIPNSQGKTLLFVLANQISITYDLDANSVVYQHPKIPGGIRSYPLTGTSIMLPLMYDDYKPGVMVCGGNKEYEIDSPAEASCGRLDLSVQGAAWEMDDFGGTPRVMPDATFLVDGTVLFINGAGTGYAGFRKGGANNAIWVNDNPVLYPTNYNPVTRIYKSLASSTIPRMYHSVSVLIPDGTVLIAGSNPQGAVALNVKYPTEYRVEIFTPPYLTTGIPRPSILSLETFPINQQRINLYYGQPATMVIQLQVPDPSQIKLKAALIHHGFTTHSQTYSQRYVYLKIESFYSDSSASNQYIVTVTLPPNPTIIAPGPSYLYIMNDNSPCLTGVAVLLGVKPS